jgi:hypothetical protein
MTVILALLLQTIQAPGHYLISEERCEAVNPSKFTAEYMRSKPQYEIRIEKGNMIDILFECFDMYGHGYDSPEFEKADGSKTMGMDKRYEVALKVLSLDPKDKDIRFFLSSTLRDQWVLYHKTNNVLALPKNLREKNSSLALAFNYLSEILALRDISNSDIYEVIRHFRAYKISMGDKYDHDEELNDVITKLASQLQKRLDGDAGTLKAYKKLAKHFKLDE